MKVSAQAKTSLAIQQKQSKVVRQANDASVHERAYSLSGEQNIYATPPPFLAQRLVFGRPKEHQHLDRIGHDHDGNGAEHNQRHLPAVRKRLGVKYEARPPPLTSPCGVRG